MTGLRKISYIFLLCLAMLVAGCGDDGTPSYPWQLQEGDGDVTLSLKVSIGNSRGVGSTRADFQHTTNPYELIHTLRVIIMREDNTVEYNRMVNLPQNSAQSTVGDLRFKVSTSLGEMVRDGDLITRSELKRIYLVANEASIPNDYVREMLENLKEGHYKEKEVTLPQGEGSETGEEETETVTTEVYIPGDTFEPSAAEGILIFNQWTQPDETRKDTYAIPMVDNEGSDKKFVPMSEFFDISVSSNLSKPNDEDIQNHHLFITRNLVKFQFEIDSTDEMDSFRVTDITFQSLMQKEYLFPNHTLYSPNKYNGDGSVNLEDKEIIEYYTPGVANSENQIRPYRFMPDNFGFNSRKEGVVNYGHSASYHPELYFCESKTLEGDEMNLQLSLFKLSIGVEFDKPYPVLDDKGEPVLDEQGNPTYEYLRMDFDADPQTLDLPRMLPRNTIVKVKMSLKNGVLSAVATVFPYTAVNLNPSFGFNIAVTSVTISERSENDEGELVVVPIDSKELREGESIDLIGTVLPANANNQDLVWTSSDTTVVTVSQIGKVTAKNLPEDAKNATVRITAMAADGAGASATCEVTVIPKIAVESIAISPSSWELKIGETTTLTPTFTPSNATIQDVKWSSSKEGVAKVSEYGVVTAVGSGKAVITAEATDGSGKSATCTIQVKDKIPVETVTLSPAPAAALYPGQQFSFNATVQPDNATNQELIWESKKPGIATVTSYGLVTAVAEGEVTITATAQDGSKVSGSRAIKVSNAPITGIVIKRGGKKVTSWTNGTPGDQHDIRAVVEPYDSTYKLVTWESSDESVATIEPIRIDTSNNSSQENYGTSIVYVVAHKEGTATIKVTSVGNPNVSTTFDVTVKEK